MEYQHIHGIDLEDIVSRLGVALEVEKTIVMNEEMAMKALRH